MNITERLAGFNSDQIANVLTELEQSLKGYENANDTIEDELSKLGRDILAIRSRMKELEDTLRQGRKLVRENKFDQKYAVREFWKSKNG